MLEMHTYSNLHYDVNENEIGSRFFHFYSFDVVEKLTDTHRQKESLFRHLQNMGFGLKELKLLFYTIKEVAAENKIPEDQAVQMFLDDIEKNYDTKLGYASTLERHKSEIQKTIAELNTNRRELSLNKEVAGVVTGLLAAGITDQQMLRLAWFLQSVYKLSIKLLIYNLSPNRDGI